MKSRKKGLLTVMYLFLFVTGISARIIDGMYYEIPKTTIPPIIDGIQDTVWKTLDANFQRSYDNGTVEPDDWADLSGWSKIMYDDDNLYGIFYTQDDSLVDQTPLAWEYDGVEIYTDADNSKSSAKDNTNDIQLVFKHAFKDDPEGNLANLGMPDFTTTDGIEFVILDDTTTMNDPAFPPSGYWLEFKIPLANLFIDPVEGSLIGFELQQNDNDNSQTRESISKWWLDVGDNSWQDPSIWGTAILSDRVVGEEFEILKTPAVPIIDGEMEPLWGQSTQATLNSRGNGNVYPDHAMDMFFRFYGLYDDANFYGFFDVYDDVLIDQTPLDWEYDSVEFYSDADNSKSSAKDNTNDIQLVFKHAYKDDPEGNLANLGMPAFSTTDGIEFAITDKPSFSDTTGYHVEFKIPLANLFINPVEGSIIGFELQTNDNDDGQTRESITKWWLDVGDASWQNPSVWGTAKLGGDAPTHVNEQVAEAPDHFQMTQNYPNPFNPVTTIEYTLTSNDRIRLSIYNLMGQEIEVLVDGIQPAGKYQVQFAGDNLVSGIYFYRLNIGDQTINKKMVLMK